MPAAGVFTSNLGRGRAGAGLAARTSPRRAGRPGPSCSPRATRTRPPGPSGRAGALALCDAVAGRLGAYRERGARRPDRPDRGPVRLRLVRAGGPCPCERGLARRPATARRPRTRSSRPTPCARWSSSSATGSASARWRRGRRCSPRTSPRCSRCSRPTRRASPRRSVTCSAPPSSRSFNRLPRRRCDLDERHRPRARLGGGRPGAPSVLGEALATACAQPRARDGRRRRGRDEDRDGDRARGRDRRRGARRRPGGRGLAPRQVLPQRGGRLLGARRQRARLGGRGLRARHRRRRLRRHAVCADGVGVAHDAVAVAAHLSGRHVEVECDLGLGTGQAAVLCCDLGPGYLDENRTTS